MTTTARRSRRTHDALVEVDWDGRVLRARGASKAGQIALRGNAHRSGDLVLWRQEIVGVTYTPPRPLANGHLTLHTRSGQRHRLPFRRGQAARFRALAQALTAAI